jgi:hypothetical protein
MVLDAINTSRNRVWIKENFLSKNAKGGQENEANFESQIL